MNRLRSVPVAGRWGFHADPEKSEHLHNLRRSGVRQKMTAELDLSVEDLVQNLIEDCALALQLEQPAAAIQADMGIAKVLSFIANETEARVQFDWNHEDVLDKLPPRYRQIEAQPVGVSG